MPSPEGILETLSSIYDAAIGTRQWPVALDEAARLLDCTVTMIGFQQRNFRVMLVNQNWMSTAHEDGGSESWSGWSPFERLERLLNDEYVWEPIENSAPLRDETHPGAECQQRLLERRIYTTEACLFREADCTAFFGAARPASAGSFDQTHIEVLRILLPHFDRAIRMLLRLSMGEVRDGYLTAALDHLDEGVIVSDRDGKVMYANYAARNLLAT